MLSRVMRRDRERRRRRRRRWRTRRWRRRRGRRRRIKSTTVWLCPPDRQDDLMRDGLGWLLYVRRKPAKGKRHTREAARALCNPRPIGDRARRGESMDPEAAQKHAVLTRLALCACSSSLLRDLDQVLLLGGYE